MQIILQITGGPSVGRKMRVHPDRITRCGCSIDADLGFPHDQAMEDMHFEFRCDGDQLLIRDLGTPTGTFLNDQKISGPSEVQDQDSISAGRTVLKVALDRSVRPVAAPAAAAAAGVAAVQAAPKEKTAIELCKPLDLEDASRDILDDSMTPLEYVQALAEHKQFTDAIKVLAFSMESRKAIWWAYQAVREHAADLLIPDDLIAFNAVYDWICTPDDRNRRSAMETGQAAEFEGPGSWLAAAAFWSGESIAPPDLPKVPPDPTLVSQAVMVSMILSATLARPRDMQGLYAEVLAFGLDFAQADELEWPKPQPVSA